MKCKFIIMSMLILGLSLGAADFSIKENSGKNIEVFYKDKAVLRFMTERDASTEKTDHETYKVYAHVIDPLDPEGKRLLTKGAGGRYTHHRGIFVGFKVKSGKSNADLWHMKGGARNNYKKILKQDVTDKSAVLTVEVDWVDGDKVLLKEERTFLIHAPEANGAFLIDLKTKLTAVDADAEIGGDREHGGCHFRASNEVASNKSAKYIIPTGKDVKTGKDLPWTAMTFKIGEQQYFVQHMTDPKAGTWEYSAYRDYGRFGSYPTKRKVAKGESVNYRFGFYISPSAFPDAAEESFIKRYSEFTQGSK
jgi:hypothetical protein